MIKTIKRELKFCGSTKRDEDEVTLRQLKTNTSNSVNVSSLSGVRRQTMTKKGEREGELKWNEKRDVMQAVREEGA